MDNNNSTTAVPPRKSSLGFSHEQSQYHSNSSSSDESSTRQSTRRSRNPHQLTIDTSSSSDERRSVDSDMVAGGIVTSPSTRLPLQYPPPSLVNSPSDSSWGGSFTPTSASASTSATTTRFTPSPEVYRSRRYGSTSALSALGGPAPVSPTLTRSRLGRAQTDLTSLAEGESSVSAWSEDTRRHGYCLTNDDTPYYMAPPLPSDTSLSRRGGARRRGIHAPSRSLPFIDFAQANAQEDTISRALPRTRPTVRWDDTTIRAERAPTPMPSTSSPGSKTKFTTKLRSLFGRSGRSRSSEMEGQTAEAASGTDWDPSRS